MKMSNDGHQNEFSADEIKLIMVTEIKDEVDKMLADGKLTATKSEILDMLIKKAIEWESRGMIKRLDDEL